MPKKKKKELNYKKFNKNNNIVNFFHVYYSKNIVLKFKF